MEAKGSACAVATWDTGSNENDYGDCGCQKPLRELPQSRPQTSQVAQRSRCLGLSVSLFFSFTVIMLEEFDLVEFGSQ